MRTIDAKPLDHDELGRLDRFWRAANHLSVGQIYLLANPMLAEPLAPEHLKPRLLGHWGTTPGLNFVYTHLNRVIAARDLDLIHVTGPGHGGPAAFATTWLDGTYTEVEPTIGRDAEGMGRLCRQFSFPGGVPSHMAPEVPGSIHEGGELGYSLSHAFGSVLDDPDALTACIVGDGEFETGPLAAGWHGTSFLDAVGDGAVVPILHLNGWKIANPTIPARIGDERLDALLRGYGWAPYLVDGDDPTLMHQTMAATLDHVVDEIRTIQADARHRRGANRPYAWPMIVLRTPKGWTGPEALDGQPIEGTWRSHQVPISGVRTDDDHRMALERWMRSYRPEELYDEDGRPRSEVVDWLPQGDRRMGANPRANGGRRRRDLVRPPVSDHAVAVARPGATTSEPTRVLGRYLRDVIDRNAQARNFRVFGPDETASNRLDAVYDVTDKVWQGEIVEVDEHLARSGRVMEILSEHTCQGWLEGYLLTGRHGLFGCYEAFVHIVDSMFNQHAKWLEASHDLQWRAPISSLNYLLTSHVWRQDHNGFSHQDPGFIDLVMNKQAHVIRVYLPPDTNTLLSVADHCLASQGHVNVIVSGKQPGPTWLSPEEAQLHCARGIGIWDWASNDEGDPDVVLACAGDVPTLETLAATDLLRRHLPELRVRVVNVVDLMRLQPESEHPHGLSDAEYDTIFPPGVPTIFAYHGYPYLIHRLTYRRAAHDDLHVRGYKEQGTTTTPFDMVVRNDLDRYHLVMDVIDRVPGLGSRAATQRQAMVDARTRHDHWVREHGEDLPEVRDWTWSG
ncbi:MAG: phosphoketolase family protein [Actinomycetota bacterium]|nr:phosphoketolase family protein [Actinomycetota bacterium]